MKFCVLSSGSKANVTLVEAAGSRILIDNGLSCKQLEIRLGGIGVDPSSIEAILVTHEHSDHIHGVPTFSKKYRVPVYANVHTAHQIPACYHKENFLNGMDFWVGAVRISPFSIIHDAVDPVGFALHAEGLKFSQATDLGRATLLVQEALKDSHAIVLESNHDQELLRNCGYTWDLKKRIASSYGHLSNDDSATLLSEVMHSDLLHVVLAHLSENSNTPQHALDTHRLRHGEMASFTLECGSIAAPTPFFVVGEHGVYPLKTMTSCSI